jgi:hypothetical protein
MFKLLKQIVFSKPLSFKQRANLVKQAGILDEQWYLNYYQDVDIDAALHFAIHGFQEGRMADERHLQLWSAQDSSELIDELHKQVLTKNPVVMPYAAWLLGRWYASRQCWKEALEVVSILVSKQGMLNVSTPVILLFVDALRHTGKVKKAKKVLLKRLKDQSSVDLKLSLANLIVAFKDDSIPKATEWLDIVNTIYVDKGLEAIGIKESHSRSIDSIECVLNQHIANDKSFQDSLVSIVVPCFNASAHIETTLRSLQHQSWQQLEIIVVDDASTDNSVELVQALADQDSRIKVVELQQNSGAYFCRNYGVSVSNGDYITVHDADDWSHCRKIELQVKAIQHSDSSMASISSWVRVSEDMQFGSWQTPSGWAGWVHRNISSLMLKKQVIEAIGYWDNVVCNADTEYYQRLLKYFGDDCVLHVLPDTPLAFGRFHAQSLTQVGPTNIFSIFGGLRKDYTDAYLNWHCSIKSREELYMPMHSAKRIFEVPPKMNRL